DASNRFVFVPHTGPNRIYQFRFNETSGMLTANDPPFVQTPNRTGPRHVAFHPTQPIVYFDNEQGSSVTSYRLDTEQGTLSPIETLPTIPENFTENNSCARLQISSDGRFLFAANRGHDSLAGFAVDAKTGRLTALGQTPTEKTPRSFNIDPSSRFVYAAGQAADKLAAYRLGEDGRLTRFATYEVGKTPWWVLTVRFTEAP
ncbi:MAG: beta-propeller fold lactonase family protein, partial [Planctomycetales bacterium]|nr:beta-propeller fold lactonase family protein [Planctomycetales bacterium]